MTKEELSILQHTLGVDEFGRGQQYRNHFCAGDKDRPVCETLVNQGFMERYPDRSFVPYPTFGVTAAGKIAMKAESPQPNRLSRSQQRYRRFLDSDTNMGFLEWLRSDAQERAV